MQMQLRKVSTSILNVAKTGTFTENILQYVRIRQ
jgi:hypothetical protein